MQEKLKRLREVYGVTQKDLAVYLDITKRSYCDKENGKRKFNADEMFALARYFQKSIEDIFLPPTHQIGDIEKKNL